MKVLVGVTGSIAAYKAAELVRLMCRREWQVRVLMTDGAAKFVTELTFRSLSRNPVARALFPDTNEWRPEHIALPEWADIFLIAPCTANVIGKLAHGIADDLLTCTALASAKPLVIAPAMNDRMWRHPAVRANVETLCRRGATFVAVDEGDLACGRQGVGRLADPETILTTVERMGRERET